jgi:hypothetical protein
MCVNLIPGHRYYEYSVWVLKLGMTAFAAMHPTLVGYNRVQLRG